VGSETERRQPERQGLLPGIAPTEAIAVATVRAGNRVALLVVDMQVGVIDGAWDASRITKNVTRVVERAREHGVPVI